MANKKKAYVRYANNKAVPGSLIVRTKAPSVGTWKEVAYDLCCDENSCSCTKTSNILTHTLLVSPNQYIGISIENTIGGNVNFTSGSMISIWVNENGGNVEALVSFLNTFYTIFGTWKSSNEGEYGTVILEMNSCLFSIYGEITSLNFISID